MSEFADAFAELLDANDESCGRPQFILLNGKKHRAIIEAVPNDPMMVGGGQAESAQFRIQVASSGFAQEPTQGEEVVQILGVGPKRDILSTESVNGAVYILTVGDLSAET